MSAMDVVFVVVLALAVLEDLVILVLFGAWLMGRPVARAVRRALGMERAA